MDEVILLDKTWDTPWMNLAYETCLMNYVEKKKKDKNLNCAILYLWQNDNTIVIGRNQNLWKECNISVVEKNNINIARRITGGGAVYHDKGNLNFSIILPKDYFNIDVTTNIIIFGLKKLGIYAEKSGRNDILLNNRKISGNAYYRTDYVGLHHGTMLLSFQSNMISKCLTPNKYKLESKSIKSVSARVGNIHMYHPDITIDMIKKAVKENFSEYFMEKETELSEGIEIANSELQSLSKKYSSEEWIYGKYNSEIGFSKQFAWGNINIIVSMEKDKIKKCNLESDAMNGQLINNLADILPVYTYNNEFKSNILKELQKRKVQFDKVMVDDIFEYLKEVIGE